MLLQQTINIMKRPSSAVHTIDSNSKKSKTNSGTLPPLRTRQPGAILSLANPQDPEVFDSQLSRALCVALHAAGFNSVKNDAFESLHNVTAACEDALPNIGGPVLISGIDMRHFSCRIKQSMHTSRRQQPLPQDFAYALASYSLTPTSLSRELETQAPSKITQPPLFPRTRADSTAPVLSQDPSISRVLGGSVDKKNRPYVPAHLPTFPLPHAFKDTPVTAKRENDARTIRELATQEGVSAEQSLRKLVAARKFGRSARVASSRDRDDLGKDRGVQDDSAFKDALASVLEEDKGTGGMRREDENLFLDEAVENKGDEPENEGKEHVELDLDSGPLVNYDRRHWRQGAASDLFGVV